MSIIKVLNDINIWKRLLFFGRNSGIHGLNHLFREDAHVLSRLFWFLILVASTGCLYLLLVPVIQLDGRLNFTPETRYLNWTTTFPAVTVCEQTTTKLAQRKFAALYPTLMDPLTYDHRRYLTDLLYARGACTNAQCLPCGEQIPCDVPWRIILENVHKKCQELLTDCSYNGEPFSCCTSFRAVDSEYGPCFSFNTQQNKTFRQESLFIVNRKTGPGALSFRLRSDAEISLHSTEELSTNNLNGKFKYLVGTNIDNRVDILFSVVEIENDSLLQDEDLSVRQCRYLHEIPDEPLHTYPVYSYGACRLARSTQHSLEHCGCIHPARDLSYKNNYCNYTGLNCLTLYEVQRIKLGLDDHDEKDCEPSCVENELTIIHFSKRWVPEEVGRGSLVNIRMSSLPTLRYRRNLMRSNLDLVVSVGGIVGLFFSASVLSFFEIFYLFLRSINN